MPLLTCLNLGLGELAHTKLTVELADRTVKYPKGIAENILLRIGNFTFLVDFIILDMTEDIKVPLILGRPFLSNAHAKIDVYKRKITLRVGEEKIIFKSVKSANSLIKRIIRPFLEDYIELNDLNEPFELKRNQGDDLMPTIEEGAVIEECRTRDTDFDTGIDDYPSYCDDDKKIHINCAHKLKFSCMIGFEFTHVNFFLLLYVNVMSKKFHNSIMKDKMVYKGDNFVGALMNVPIFVETFSVVTDFAILEDMDAYREDGMGEVIVGEPFLSEVGIKARRFDYHLQWTSGLLVYKSPLSGFPDYSMVFGLWMFKTYDREPLLAHELCVNLLSGSRDTNLYTISLDDMLTTSPICLLSKASKTKSWLWHRRLSHLNFDTLNKLAKDGIARGIQRLKFQKDHLCSTCALGKSKKSSHQPKAKDTNQEKLYLLHMDLCGPMRVARINGKRYILVIVGDYSRFTSVRFFRTTDEAPEAIIKCIKNIQVRLNATVRNVRTDNGTEFVNQTLHEFYENAEAINTACYTQNHSLIRLRYNKTPYELMQKKKPDLSFFHVFGALCYPTNDNDDLGKLDAKADIDIFVGYTPAKKAFKIYNKRTQKIIETIHVTFDELTAMASEQFSLGPELYSMTPATSSSGLVPNSVSQQPCIPPRDDWDRLFKPMFDEYFTPPSIAVTPVQDATTPRAVVLVDSLVSTSIDHDAPSTSIPST
ncbi:retrovirus-related pol polyprotein from transposon TNT 1-94 [Tanacetum coccineum]